MIVPVGDPRGETKTHVRFGLGRVEWVDQGLDEHRREHQVLEHLDALQRPGLVVVAKRFEEVHLRRFPVFCVEWPTAVSACRLLDPLPCATKPRSTVSARDTREGMWPVRRRFRSHRTFAHMHLAAALADDPHDLGVRDGRSHPERLLVERLGWGARVSLAVRRARQGRLDEDVHVP